MKALIAAVAAALAVAFVPTAQAAPLQGAVYHPDGKVQLTTVAWHRHYHRRHHHHHHHHRHYR